MPDSRNLGVPDPGESTYQVQRKNHLLAIGIDQYEYVGKLSNAVQDAKAFVEVLLNQYEFFPEQVYTLYDKQASRESILDAFESLSETLGPRDNLIIYFAGHGYYRQSSQVGSLVPVKGRGERQSSMIFNSVVQDYIKGFSAHHVFLIVDSCYSGAFLTARRAKLGGEIDQIEAYAERVDPWPSRWGLAAGAIELVADGLAGSNSPFNQALVGYLQNQTASKFAISELINHVQRVVVSNTDQRPIGGILLKTGDENGEFVFKRKLNEEGLWTEVKLRNTTDALERYLSLFPKGKYYEKALGQIDTLEEEADWEKAQRRDTLEGYKRYKRRYPKGKYLPLAKDRIEQLLLPKEPQPQEKVPVETHDSNSKQVSKGSPPLVGLYKPEELLVGTKLLSIDLGVWISLGAFIVIIILALWRTELWQGASDDSNLDLIDIELTRPQAILLTKENALAEIDRYMVIVPEGSYEMGSEKGQNDEKPLHRVNLSAFELGRFEVTQAQWEAIMESNPSFHKNCPNCPVEEVSWEDVQGFISKINELSGERYRLPTEAEWEYTARAGRNYRYSGSDFLDQVAWNGKNSEGKTHPSGTKKPNAWGFYDLSGNVWEWCQDSYGAYPEGPSSNPISMDTSQRRVLRGGSWGSLAARCRVSFRGNDGSSDRNYAFGFRLARGGVFTQKNFTEKQENNSFEEKSEGVQNWRDRYDKVEPLYEAYHIVHKDEKRGYVDVSGKEIIAPRFDRAWEFGKEYEGLAKVRLAGREFYIDIKEKEFTHPKSQKDVITNIPEIGYSNPKDDVITKAEALGEIEHFMRFYSVERSNMSLNNFGLSQYGVTQAQWEAIMENNTSQFKDCLGCPVEDISMEEAQKFIERLNLLSGRKYRLPTEEELKYALGDNRTTFELFETDLYLGLRIAKDFEPQDSLWHTHLVRPGETLYRIFVTYGVPVDQLKKINKLRSNYIRQGMILKIRRK